MRIIFSYLAASNKTHFCVRKGQTISFTSYVHQLFHKKSCGREQNVYWMYTEVCVGGGSLG